MIDHSLERARLLIEQNRCAEAEKELQKTLASDPNNAETFLLLSICKLKTNKLDEAETLIKTAINLAPANPYLLNIYAQILYNKGNYSEAEKIISEAIQGDPHNADFFAVLSTIHLHNKDWNKALAAANQGLSIAPDNISCLNIRSTALIKLDKKEESYSTIQEALYHDPENAHTHANLGWGLLEKGDHKQALKHFTKALQIDPESEFAKAGLVQALKAKYLVYRYFLKYAFWIGNMKGKMQWGIIIGFYVGARIIRYIANTNPTLSPFLTPLIVLYTIFAVSTWIIGPLTNLFLRLNVYGKYALTDKEITTSNFVGISLLIGLIGGITYIFIPTLLFAGIGFYGLTMMIPLSKMLDPVKNGKKQFMIAYTAALALTGASGLILLAQENPVFDTFGLIYIIGLVAFQWVGNFILMR
ncbi:MAG: tetratricopeptide repeat protein [Cytophagales bacterium]|nr:tetratricopeptide repeat protein [Cytophaga sp.]